MMIRFAAEELVAGHPYDPDLTFARRLFLLGTTATRYAGVHALSNHDFLRRNSIALVPRLGITGAEDILLRVVEESDDPVSRIRAIRGLGQCGKLKVAKVLVQRLREERDRVEACALVRTLGKLGGSDAAAAVAAYGQRHSRDGEVLLSVLTALSELPVKDDREGVVKWLEGLAKNTDQHPDSWKPNRRGMPADQPDPTELRGRILHQLCVLALARQGAVTANTVLDLVNGPRFASVNRGASSNESLGGVLPTAAPAFLNLVSYLGSRGQSRLEQVVRDRTADPVLRAQALRNLSAKTRGDLASEIANPKSRTFGRGSLKICALEVLQALEHDDLEQRARDIVDGLGRGNLTEMRLAERYLLLLAIKALGHRGKLDWKTLSPMLKDLDLRPRAGEELMAELRERVTKLVGLRPAAAIRTDCRMSCENWCSSWWRPAFAAPSGPAIARVCAISRASSCRSSSAAASRRMRRSCATRSWPTSWPGARSTPTSRSSSRGCSSRGPRCRCWNR